MGNKLRFFIEGGKMKRKGSIILPVLIIIIVISLAAVAGLVYIYQTEHSENLKLKDQIVELETRQKITESKLEETKKSAADLSIKLQEAKGKIDSLTEELAQEKIKYNETAGQLEQSVSDLLQQKTLRQDLENSLNQAQDEGKKIKEQLKIIQKQKTDLEEKIKNLEAGSGGVELGRVIVNNENSSSGRTISTGPKVEHVESKAQVAAAKKLEGKIMVINQEFNFAVINLGSKDNLELGDEFSVLSASGNPIGVLRVEKVHESMSAAGFSPEIKDVIKENDRIVKKVK